MDGLPGELVQMDGDLAVDIVTAKLLAQWDWRDEHASFGDQQGSLRCRSSSPESSFYSTCSSPETQRNASDCQTLTDFAYNGHGRKGSKRAQLKPPKPKMSTKRRMKASEREKLRMRSLAEALHQLRDYLPPVYSRKGQPLTKIQTLKYTIEYIKELSDILSQE
ncbi:mesogenin-1 [Brachyhypopomus gauderio]|uniref:mesogenin-1 n=1 Tax=Brachyhypopomus gauderio TaxID=698409 RepID=UPI0040427C25